MYLSTLTLRYFKNYDHAGFLFCPQLNFLSGKNGAGKTNILDAIHYLCLGKSNFHSSDQYSIHHGQGFFRIEGSFEGATNHQINCSFRSGEKKQLEKNRISYTRILDHVGLIPLVMITPDDQLLIDEGSEERRRFMNNTISQIDHLYLEILVEYNRLLQHRNALLKLFVARGKTDRSLIETIDHQLAEAGVRIFEGRKKYLEVLIPHVVGCYRALSGNDEEVSAVYNCICQKEDLFSALGRSFEKDFLMQRTLTGIHRDELDFFLNGKSLRKFGSQGQKKSFLMAIKLAQYEVIRIEKNQKPLLLLDDVFDKLDESRTTNLLQIINGNEFGQIFITDTQPERIRKFIAGSPKAYDLFTIEKGGAFSQISSPEKLISQN